MEITEIAFTVYPASDIKASRDFYEEVLGLAVYEVVDYGQEGGVAGEYWVEYEVGGSIFAITNSLKLSKQSGIAFEVKNYDEAMKCLRDSDVAVVMDRIDSPVCCFAVVADPNGNEVTIHKRKPNVEQDEKAE